jgi:hypothetical protein
MIPETCEVETDWARNETEVINNTKTLQKLLVNFISHPLWIKICVHPLLEKQDEAPVMARMVGVAYFIVNALTVVAPYRFFQKLSGTGGQECNRSLLSFHA